MRVLVWKRQFELWLVITDFWVSWDGPTQKPNRDSLNGTKAVADLINDIFDAMKSDGISDESNYGTCIGWVYFWSDSFLRCFVKQKDNSV